MPGGFTGVGREDGDSGQGGGEGEHAAGAGYDSGGDVCAVQGNYVESIVPKGCTVEVRMIHSGDPIVISTDNEFVAAATEAMKTVFGKETVFVRGGGSIPIVGDFVREAGDSDGADGIRTAGRQSSCAE